MPEQDKDRGLRAEPPSRGEGAEVRRQATSGTGPRPGRPDRGRSGARPARRSRGAGRGEGAGLGPVRTSYWPSWLLATTASIRIGSLPEGLGPPQARRGLTGEAQSTRASIPRARLARPAEAPQAESSRNTRFGCGHGSRGP